MHKRRLVWLAGTLLLAGCFQNTVLDKGMVKEATEAHFGNPVAPIEVGPVVVSGNHAIADWTQGDYGGRALFERNGGSWMLLLCSGDSIREAGNLRRAGVPDFNAGWMAEQLSKAEAGVPAERLARLKRFTGTARDHEEYVRTLERKP